MYIDIDIDIYRYRYARAPRPYARDSRLACSSLPPRVPPPVPCSWPSTARSTRNLSPTPPRPNKPLSTSPSPSPLGQSVKCEGVNGLTSGEPSVQPGVNP